MKKLILSTLAIFLLITTSCSSDDDNPPVIPVTATGTVRFEVTTTLARKANITTKIDDQTETETDAIRPFNAVYTDVVLTSGKFLL